jgi:metal-responsive CopG/Arc/MetJ family transcriptional regulator
MSTLTGRTSRILNISVPPEMYEAIEAVAQQENRTKSELIREAFRHYQFIRRWRSIREWGRETAERLGIETDEDLEQFLD